MSCHLYRYRMGALAIMQNDCHGKASERSDSLAGHSLCSFAYSFAIRQVIIRKYPNNQGRSLRQLYFCHRQR